MVSAFIFDLQHFCLDDGPGIRSTVFFKGCPLRCRWCHNPEGLSGSRQISLNRNLCVQCGKCAQVCKRRAQAFEPQREIDRSACASCGACAQACSTGALTIIGREVTVSELADEIVYYREYFQHGGGVTFSGGEPMLQHVFCRELARTLHEQGIHTAMETSGFASREAFASMLPFIDLFLYDCKVRPELYREYTGAAPDVIFENLDFLSAAAKEVILRCPIIPGVNDDDAHFAMLADVLERNPGIQRVELEPYHSMGLQKALQIGRSDAMAFDGALDRELLRRRARRLEEIRGVEVAIN